MTMTARELVAKIESLSPHKPAEGTVDRIIVGQPDTPVAGVATTFISSLGVLRQATAAGCNFVITHEPTFYNHHDDPAGWEDDAVVAAKRKHIADHRMVVYRYHDMPHRIQPDMIVAGVIDQLGWPQPQRNDRGTHIVHVRTMTLAALAADVRRKTGGRAARFIGDPSQTCSAVALCVGSPGPRSEFPALTNPDVDVMVIGECDEWAAGEYVRDANAAGRQVGLIFLGHRNSEEAGMSWIARWLSDRLSINVQHLVVDDPVTCAG
jgi:putative NIF3 family GTP cyclohydrolase 1 type 2